MSKLVYACPTTQSATVVPVGSRPTWRSKAVAISGVISYSMALKSLAATLVMICPRWGLSPRWRFPRAGEIVSGRDDVRLLPDAVSSKRFLSRSRLALSNISNMSLVDGMYLIGATESSKSCRLVSTVCRTSGLRCSDRWIGVKPPAKEFSIGFDMAVRASTSKLDCVASSTLVSDSMWREA